MDNDLLQKKKHIAKAIAQGNYRYKLHAAQQRIARKINRSEVEIVLTNGEIIEDYPDHHYGPACLVYGKAKQGKVINFFCSLKTKVDIIRQFDSVRQKCTDYFK